MSEFVILWISTIFSFLIGSMYYHNHGSNPLKSLSSPLSIFLLTTLIRSPFFFLAAFSPLFIQHNISLTCSVQTIQ
ncbi:hypothetical protein DL89DRAFT_177446 [Linderina pennispora]|uniref:Uncharacterized protein n=1 Tax=Linderina pennispora TaxID=61395 RepID=A0A1Y1W524_9FUNG|nr:uncharacterized protein DL89DRAFT_177446 [Linderina pennispora]ORX68455.1 hypothetical protein DL89DRAFT_177446 [Linderina pennispora]